MVFALVLLSLVVGALVGAFGMFLFIRSCVLC